MLIKKVNPYYEYLWALMWLKFFWICCYHYLIIIFPLCFLALNIVWDFSCHPFYVFGIILSVILFPKYLFVIYHLAVNSFSMFLYDCFFLFVRRFIFSDTNIDFLDSIADVCNVWCISYWNCYNLWSGASLGCRFCMVSSWWKVGSLRMGWCSPCARYDNDLNVPVVLLFTIFWLSYCMTNSLTTYFNESKVWHNGMHWEPLNTVTSVELCVIVFDTFWTWHLSDMLSTCVWLSLLCQITFLSLDTSSTQIEHK